MKKFLTFVLVLAMVLSVSSVALAVYCTDGNACTAHVAAIGNEHYDSLADAVDAAVATSDAADVTITLLKSYTGCGIKLQADAFKTHTLTFDFNSKEYTVGGSAVGSSGTETLGMQLNKGNNVVLKNGTLKSTATDSSGVKMLINNYANLTLVDMILDGSGITDTPASRYTLSNNSGTVVIEDTEITAPTGGFAFDVCDYASYDAPSVTVKGDSEINGNVEVSEGGGNSGGTGDPTLNIEGGEVNGDITKAFIDGDISITGGTFSEGYSDIKDFIEGDPIVARVDNKTVVGEDDIEAAANSQSNITVQPISGEGNLDLDTTKGNQVVITDDMKDKVTINGQALEPNASPQQIPSIPQTTAKPSSGGGYYGPDVWYIGGNTFGTNTNQVPTSVEIDGVPVSFTMNGSQITVGCIQPGSGWVTVRWGSVSNYRSFTPDANAYCTQTVIPKTGGMSIWTAIAQFLGF